MSNPKDKLCYLTAKVNGGSGCLFQPADSSYSYILTAKHVLNDAGQDIVRQYIDENGTVVNEPLEIIGAPFRHPDENKDAAIVKIKPVEKISELIRAEMVVDTGNIYLCGHPASRDGDLYSFRENKLTIENKKPHGYIEAELSKNVVYSEVVGQSGGGIIKIDASCFLLLGVQKQMAVDDKKEALSRIDFMPLSFFDEIIHQNSDDLSPLFPPYIASFERLINDIFPLPNMLGKRELIQNELRVIAGALCTDFSPERILGIYRNEFLANNTDKAIINHKQLWISFLELLTFNQLHQDTSITLAQLSEMHKKRKLFIVDSDAWTKNVQDIYKTDLSEIESGGTVVVCATRDTCPTKVEISPPEMEMIIGDISNPISMKNISNTIQNPFSELKLINIYKFQSHIINNALAYKDSTVLNAKETLKDETRNLI